jgi:hypothetical protein
MKLKIILLLVLSLYSYYSNTVKFQRTKYSTKQNDCKTIIQYDKLSGKQLLKPNNIILCSNIAQPDSSGEISKEYVFTLEPFQKYESFNIIHEEGVWKIATGINNFAVPYRIKAKGVFYRIAYNLFFLKNKLLLFNNGALTKLDVKGLEKDFSEDIETLHNLNGIIEYANNNIQGWTKVHYIISNLNINRDTKLELDLLFRMLNKINQRNIKIFNKVINSKTSNLYNLSKLLLFNEELLDCFTDEKQDYHEMLEFFRENFLDFKSAVNKGDDKDLKAFINSISEDTIGQDINSLYIMGLENLSEYINLYDDWQLNIKEVGEKQNPVSNNDKIILDMNNKELIISIFDGIPESKMSQFLYQISQKNLDVLRSLILTLKQGQPKTILDKINDLMNFVSPFIIDINLKFEEYIIDLNKKIPPLRILFTKAFRDFHSYIENNASKNPDLDPQDFAKNVDANLNNVNGVIKKIKALLTDEKLNVYKWIEVSYTT